MPTLRSDQPPVNAPKTVSTQVNSTRMPARPPSAIGARTPGMATGAPLPGTPTNPGLSADQPVPSIGAARPMATAQPAQKPPAKHKTGLEGLTPQASLQPGRRKQIIGIISKHAEHLPTNCVLTLVEKLVEKHAERALSGVTDVIKKAALKRWLKQAFINPGTLSGAVSAGEDNRMLGALAGTGGGLVGGGLGSALGGVGGLMTRKSELALLLAAIGGLGGSLYGGHVIGKSIRKLKNEPKEPAESEQTKTSAVKKGTAFRGFVPILKPRVMREFVKRASNKPQAARLFARLVKAATILNSKG